LVVVVAAEDSAHGVSIIVSVVLGGVFVLLLMVLLSILVVCRRRRRKLFNASSRGRRLPTFADMTVNSEITSFLPAAGPRTLDRGPPIGTGVVSRQPTAETDDMPPSYDSVVKTSDVPVRRRRNGDLSSSARRTQARLSLPPFTSAAIPRTHRRAESDTEEHVYEDPASLRRSTYEDPTQSSVLGYESDHVPENLIQDLVSQARPSGYDGDRTPINFVEMLRGGGAAPSEVANPSPSEPLMSGPVMSIPMSAGVLPYPRAAAVETLPYAISSLFLPNVAAPGSQTRVPRVRLGTSALYFRPDSRGVDSCRTGGLPLQPFSPLSTVGYSEIADEFGHQYQVIPNDHPSVRNPSLSFRSPSIQDHWDNMDSRSPVGGVCSMPSGNRHHSHDEDFSPDLSLAEDQLNSTSSARSSSAESLRFDVSQVSPLCDHDSPADVVV